MNSSLENLLDFSDEEPKKSKKAQPALPDGLFDFDTESLPEPDDSEQPALPDIEPDETNQPAPPDNTDDNQSILPDITEDSPEDSTDEESLPSVIDDTAMPDQSLDDSPGTSIYNALIDDGPIAPEEPSLALPDPVADGASDETSGIDDNDSLSLPDPVDDDDSLVLNEDDDSDKDDDIEPIAQPDELPEPDVLPDLEDDNDEEQSEPAFPRGEDDEEELEFNPEDEPDSEEEEPDEEEEIEPPEEDNHQALTKREHVNDKDKPEPADDGLKGKLHDFIAKAKKEISPESGKNPESKKPANKSSKHKPKPGLINRIRKAWRTANRIRRIMYVASSIVLTIILLWSGSNIPMALNHTESNDKQADEGSLSISKASYDNGEATAVLTNKSDMIAHVYNGKLHVYTYRPGLSLPSLIAPKQAAVCSFDGLDMNPGESKTIKANCGKVSGFWPRVRVTVDY